MIIDFHLGSPACHTLGGPSPDGRFRHFTNQLRRGPEVVVVPATYDKWTLHRSIVGSERIVFVALRHAAKLQKRAPQVKVANQVNTFTEPDRGFCLHPHDQADGFYE
jgi:hypothetical protein